MPIKTKSTIVNSVADLGTLRAADGDVVSTLGYHASSPGTGSATYMYRKTGRSTHTADSVLYFNGPGTDDYYALVHDGVIDVTQAGAIPGASGSSNAAAIQAALDASGDVCKLTIRDGEYDVNERLYMDNKRYVIEGNGASIHLGSVLDDYHFLQNRDNDTPVSSFVCKGVTFKDRANASAEWKAVISLEKCGYTLIEECSFVDTSTTCIQVGSQSLVMAEGTQGAVTINKCRCYNTNPGSFIGGNFAKIEDATAFFFTKNECRDMSRPMTLELGNNRDIDSVVVAENIIENCKLANKSSTQTAIPIHINAQFSGCEIKSVVIANNVIRDTDTSGTSSQGAAIYVTSNSVGLIRSCSITGNVVQNTVLTGKENASYVVITKNLQNLTFSNNVFQGTAYSDSFSLTVDDGTDVCTATGHNFTDTTPVVLTTTGTLPAGLATSTVYYVRDTSGSTFKLAATSGGTAIDITDTGTGAHTVNAIYRGIVFQGCVNSVISGNQLDGDFAIGIYVWNTTDSIVIGNLMSGTYASGGEIFASGATDTAFANNYANGSLVS